VPVGPGELSRVPQICNCSLERRRRLTLYAPAGKTAPRLITDLLDYDPRYRLRNGKNLLADPAPQFHGDPFMRKGPNDCRHSLIRKENQTSAPTSPDEQPDRDTKYVVASFCARCRYHFDITVDFRHRGGDVPVPCKLSDMENPMHHLHLVETSGQLAGPITSKPQELPYEEYRFVCSGSHCPVSVEIRITPPRLSKKLLALFLDVNLLQARGEKVISQDPNRYQGLVPLKPIQVLANIRTFLTDAKAQSLKTDEPPKRLAKRNKKYVLAFENECDALFLYLGFKEINEIGEDVSVKSLVGAA
jgi:ubiquitin carboxyl-terminal hydrolase 25/28